MEVAMRVLMSIGGPTVFETAGPAGEILIGTANGVAWLTRASQEASWRVTSRALEGKHVSNLVEDPDTGRLFAGVHREGIFASDDGGHTWQRRDRGMEHVNIYSMSVARGEDGVRLYAGTEPAHLYESRDHGESWRELPSLRSVPSVKDWMFPAPPHVAHVKHITFDPRSADTIYASVEVGGAFKSTDAGRTWRQLGGFFEDVHRLEVTAARPDHVFMGNGIGIYHSPDAGETWEQLTDRSARIAYPDLVIVHPRKPDTLFIAGAICGPGEWRNTKTADARIARSRDGGKHWQYLEGGLPVHIHGNIEGLVLHLWPGGATLFAGTTDGDVFVSDDEGDTWSTIATRIGAVSKGGHYLALPLDALAEARA
jgi:photosystem II stability/assembly factor-like uncharacterized protein